MRLFFYLFIGGYSFLVGGMVKAATLEMKFSAPNSSQNEWLTNRHQPQANGLYPSFLNLDQDGIRLRLIGHGANRGKFLLFGLIPDKFEAVFHSTVLEHQDLSVGEQGFQVKELTRRSLSLRHLASNVTTDLSEMDLNWKGNLSQNYSQKQLALNWVGSIGKKVRPSLFWKKSSFKGLSGIGLSRSKTREETSIKLEARPSKNHRLTVVSKQQTVEFDNLGQSAEMRHFLALYTGKLTDKFTLQARQTLSQKSAPMTTNFRSKFHHHLALEMAYAFPRQRWLRGNALWQKHQLERQDINQLFGVTPFPKRENQVTQQWQISGGGTLGKKLKGDFFFKSVNREDLPQTRLALVSPKEKSTLLYSDQQQFRGSFALKTGGGSLLRLSAEMGELKNAGRGLTQSVRSLHLHSQGQLTPHWHLEGNLSHKIEESRQHHAPQVPLNQAEFMDNAQFLLWGRQNRVGILLGATRPISSKTFLGLHWDYTLGHKGPKQDSQGITLTHTLSRDLEGKLEFRQEELNAPGFGNYHFFGADLSLRWEFQ